MNLGRLGLACLFLFGTAHAQVASFTSQEISDHSENIGTIAMVSAQCLDDTYQEHLDFFALHGISKFYGNRRPEYQSKQGLVNALLLYGKSPELVSQLEPKSCIGLAMDCLEKGFRAAGLSATWDKIHAHLAIGNKFLGTDLQKNLIKLGWKSYYWNPNPSRNEAWDAEDQSLTPAPPGKWNPVWGGHVVRYRQATEQGFYYEASLVIHDAESLVDFRSTQPAFFKDVPFFVGTAHAGYHVFPGRNGEVIEAHSMRYLNSKDNLEYSEFNPLAPGGGPRWTDTEKYRSGVIVTPY